MCGAGRAGKARRARLRFLALAGRISRVRLYAGSGYPAIGFPRAVDGKSFVETNPPWPTPSPLATTTVGDVEALNSIGERGLPSLTMVSPHHWVCPVALGGKRCQDALRQLSDAGGVAYLPR